MPLILTPDILQQRLRLRGQQGQMPMSLSPQLDYGQQDQQPFQAIPVQSQPQNRYTGFLGDALQGIGSALLSDDGSGPDLARGFGLTAQLGQQRQQQQREDDLFAAQQQQLAIQNRRADQQFGFERDKFQNTLDQQQQQQQAIEQQKQAVEDAINGMQLTPQQAAVARANPEAFLNEYAKNQFSNPELKTITYREGNQEKTALFDPRTGKMTPIASGNAFPPQQASEFDRLLAAAGVKPGSPEAESYAKQKLVGNNGVVVYDPQTGQPVVQFGGGKPLTQDQAKVATFADRIDANIEAVYSPESVKQLTDIGQNLAGKIPILGNSMVSEQYQVAKNAALNSVSAVLRNESGGAITPEESILEAQKYIPEPGDTQAVIDQKRRNLQIVIDGYRRQAGFKPNNNNQQPSQGKKVLNYNPATGDFQ